MFVEARVLGQEAHELREELSACTLSALWLSCCRAARRASGLATVSLLGSSAVSAYAAESSPLTSRRS